MIGGGATGTHPSACEDPSCVCPNLNACALPASALAAALTSLSIFRPRVSLSRELLHLNLDLADLLAHGRSRTYAIEARWGMWGACTCRRTCPHHHANHGTQHVACNWAA